MGERDRPHFFIALRSKGMSSELRSLVAQLESNIAKVVLGKGEVIRFCVVALLAGEHVLLEDVPGVGKTLIGKALARSVDARFNRIQFTPDLLPSDIVGTSIFNTKSSEFTYNEGPIFANIVLADEINRTTPRTQSALLEAMSDAQVSSDGHTHVLPKPFMVIATQNPFEFEGTYPLPESQLDRFLIRTSVGYPDREDELQVLLSHRRGEPVEQLQPVLSCAQVLQLQQAARSIAVDDSIVDYMMNIVEATRASDELQVGVSTRGALGYYHAIQALAMAEGREYAIPDDAKRLAVPVLAHRVVSRSYAHANQRQAVESIVARLVDESPVPR